MNNDEIRHIIQYLRKASLTWAGRNECLKRFRESRPAGQYLSGKPKTKLFWQCQACKTWWPDSSALEVDHIVEIGPFEGDWNVYIAKMFCDQSNLTLLCSPCHQKKTNWGNAARKFERKDATSL